MSKKYVVEFTKEQLTVMARGLEFYSRFLAGQWEIPDAMEFKEYELQEKYNGFWEKRNYVEEQLRILKSHFTGLHINASYGIGSENLDEDAKIAYDIYRPVWEEFNKNSESWNVYSSPGLQYGKEGRIKIEGRNDEES
jgi:hypothetical protein